jgi:sec-independent protein translocase protein TatA
MLAAGIGPIGPIEGLIILAVVIIIFGVGRLPEVGGAIGRSLREFRKATKDEDKAESTQAQASVAPPAESFCSNCGAQVNPEAKFCAKCGAPTQAAVS